MLLFFPYSTFYFFFCSICIHVGITLSTLSMINLLVLMFKLFFSFLETTINPYACGNMTYLVGYDLYGNNLRTTQVASYSICCQKCLMNHTCVGFAWQIVQAGATTSICYLKKASEILKQTQR